MKFLIDQNLPLALAAWLREAGVEAVHVREAGLATANDAEIVRRARRENEIIVSLDRDYVPAAGGHPATWLQVVWIRLPNPSTSELLDRWAADWGKIREALKHGEELVELV